MRELLARPSGTVGGANSGFGQSAEDEEAALMLMIEVEQRVANWSALPPNHLEGWQVSCLLSSWTVHSAVMLNSIQFLGEAAALPCRDIVLYHPQGLERPRRLEHS